MGKKSKDPKKQSQKEVLPLDLNFLQFFYSIFIPNKKELAKVEKKLKEQKENPDKFLSIWKEKPNEENLNKIRQLLKLKKTTEEKLRLLEIAAKSPEFSDDLYLQRAYLSCCVYEIGTKKSMAELELLAQQIDHKSIIQQEAAEAKVFKELFDINFKNAQKGDLCDRNWLDKFCCNLIMFYGQKKLLPDEASLQKVFLWHEKRSREGSIIAKYHLVHHYKNGIGTTQSQIAAFYICDELADLNYIPAIGELGLFYLAGIENEGIENNLEKDEKKGIQLIRYAAANGCSFSQFTLYRFYKGGKFGITNEEGMKYLKLSANAGLSIAKDIWQREQRCREIEYEHLLSAISGKIGTEPEKVAELEEDEKLHVKEIKRKQYEKRKERQRERDIETEKRREQDRLEKKRLEKEKLEKEAIARSKSNKALETQTNEAQKQNKKPTKKRVKKDQKNDQTKEIQLKLEKKKREREAAEKKKIEEAAQKAAKLEVHKIQRELEKQKEREAVKAAKAVRKAKAKKRRKEAQKRREEENKIAREEKEFQEKKNKEEICQKLQSKNPDSSLELNNNLEKIHKYLSTSGIFDELPQNHDFFNSSASKALSQAKIKLKGSFLYQFYVDVLIEVHDIDLEIEVNLKDIDEVEFRQKFFEHFLLKDSYQYRAWKGHDGKGKLENAIIEDDSSKQSEDCSSKSKLPWQFIIRDENFIKSNADWVCNFDMLRVIFTKDGFELQSCNEEIYSTSQLLEDLNNGQYKINNQYPPNKSFQKRLQKYVDGGLLEKSQIYELPEQYNHIKRSMKYPLNAEAEEFSLGEQLHIPPNVIRPAMDPFLVSSGLKNNVMMHR